ncbi:hypothetical protein Y032_0008g102 [Ancylostoma ceylanicum]|nr:hypothetical protein Y032_0008g102 [Ancylostoma ceylanicum]
MALILLLFAFFSIAEAYAQGKLAHVTLYTTYHYTPRYNEFYEKAAAIYFLSPSLYFFPTNSIHVKFFSFLQVKDALPNHGVTVSRLTFRAHPERGTLLVDIFLDVDCITLQEIVRKMVTERAFITSADVRCGRERYFVSENYQ